MEKKIKIKFQGRDVDATPIEVNQASENWNTYLLDDGTVLKLKTVVTKVVRIDNAYDPEGNPIYTLQSTPIVRAADVPDNLKKKQ